MVPSICMSSLGTDMSVMRSCGHTCEEKEVKRGSELVDRCLNVGLRTLAVEFHLIYPWVFFIGLGEQESDLDAYFFKSQILRCV